MAQRRISLMYESLTIGIYTCIYILLYFYIVVQEPLKKNIEPIEHRTSNVQRPTSNNDVAPLPQLISFFNYFCFLPL